MVQIRSFSAQVAGDRRQITVSRESDKAECEAPGNEDLDNSIYCYVPDAVFKRNAKEIIRFINVHIDKAVK